MFILNLMSSPSPAQASPPNSGRAVRSHFSLRSGVVKACAVSSATAMLSGVCSAQIAADYATDPTYSSGWSAGQNGGYGFGPWSFNGTDPALSVQQGMSTPAFQQGRIVYDPSGSGKSEHGLHHFHGLILKAYAEAAG